MAYSVVSNNDLM